VQFTKKKKRKKGERASFFISLHSAARTGRIVAGRYIAIESGLDRAIPLMAEAILGSIGISRFLHSFDTIADDS
jgi:hypothetical protein